MRRNISHGGTIYLYYIEEAINVYGQSARLLQWYGDFPDAKNVTELNQAGKSCKGGMGRFVGFGIGLVENKVNFWGYSIGTGWLEGLIKDRKTTDKNYRK